MSAQEDDQNDKSFEPTPQKLLEARKRGEIARSLEILTAASYFGLFISLSIFGFSHLTQLGGMMTVLIDQSAQLAPLFFEGGAATPTQGILGSMAWAVLPFFALPASAVLAVLLATRGIVFAPVKIQPKLSKISVIANAKNKFGRNGLFQFSLSFVKLNIYSLCLFAFLYFRLDQLVASIRFSPQNIVSLLATICIEFLMVVVIVSALIGGTDAIWQYFEHRRKNRMSRKEILDETKNSEGDPHMKQERRQRGQAKLASSMVKDVSAADVIIVNPTHFSVALRWDRKPGQAPVCVAKGIDHMALKIREIAIENAVPIYSDPPTARALHATTDIGAQILPEQYKAVAAAIRFAENMREKAKGWAS